jgi:hypothetical protein
MLYAMLVVLAVMVFLVAVKLHRLSNELRYIRAKLTYVHDMAKPAETLALEARAEKEQAARMVKVSMRGLMTTDEARKADDVA